MITNWNPKVGISWSFADLSICMGDMGSIPDAGRQGGRQGLLLRVAMDVRVMCSHPIQQMGARIQRFSLPDHPHPVAHGLLLRCWILMRPRFETR